MCMYVQRPVAWSMASCGKCNSHVPAHVPRRQQAEEEFLNRVLVLAHKNNRSQVFLSKGF